MLLYEMLAGRSPFDIVGATDNPDQNTEDYLFQVTMSTGFCVTLVFQVILEKTIRIPRSLSVKAASILKGFLNKNPADRLGCHRDSGFGEIMNHPFFKVDFPWETPPKKNTFSFRHCPNYLHTTIPIKECFWFCRTKNDDYESTATMEMMLVIILLVF